MEVTSYVSGVLGQQLLAHGNRIVGAASRIRTETEALRAEASAFDELRRWLAANDPEGGHAATVRSIERQLRGQLGDLTPATLRLMWPREDDEVLDSNDPAEPAGGAP